MQHWKIRRGDMVKVSTNLGFIKCYFVLWCSPYPMDDSLEYSREADKFCTEDIGIVLNMMNILKISSKRQPGLYVEILSQRGKAGWMNSANLEVIQSISF